MRPHRPPGKHGTRSTILTSGFAAVDGNGSIVGWAAARGVSDRFNDAGIVEHAIYVDPAGHRGGVGRLVLNTLITAATDTGIWTIQSGIFPENTPSIALHHACGFRTVAIRATGLTHLRLHDMRHTGNTLAAATGASTRELMARMGHASARAALIHQHVSAERDRAIASAPSELAGRQRAAPEPAGDDQ